MHRRFKMDYYYKQPRYFSKFRCIGGECTESCCDGWTITWTQEELDRLNTIDCPEEFRDLIERSFSKNTKPGSDNYVVNLVNEFYAQNGELVLDERALAEGKCPFHDNETGLCLIQKNYGEKYLGSVCTQYPRRYYNRDQIYIRSCSTSCPAVVDILLKNKDAAEMETVIARDVQKLSGKSTVRDTVEAVEKSPYIKKRLEIIDFYTELFNKFDNIEDSIVLGALAAKKITDTVKTINDADNIPSILNSYKKQFSADSILDSIKGIESNYKLKFLIINNLVYQYFGTRKDYIDISMLHDGEQLIPERYLEGKAKFAKAFEGREYALRNVAINMFLDIFVQLNMTQGSFFETYSVFTAFVAVLQVFACAIGYESDDVEKKFIKITAMLNRGMSHNKERADKVLEKMKELGLTTPAHLALIIK